MFGLADRLNKTIAEIEDMTYNELTEWVAYLEMMQQDGRKS